MSENNSSLTYPVFKMLSTINEAQSRLKGRPIYDDQEICEIRFSGNKQTVGVFPAHEECEWGDDPVTQERVRITYAQKFNDQYKKFKAGEAQAAHGTPLEELTFLTQGKRLELKALNIYTAESLAALDGNNLRMLGPNGRELKNQAQFYLDSAAKNTDAMSVIAENAELKKRIEALEKASGKTPKKGKGKTEPESDLISDEDAEEVEEVEDAGAEEDDQPEEDQDEDGKDENPFNDWEPEDIKNWIADADPECEIDGRWGKKKLAAKAKEINDAIAAAKSGA